MRFHTFSGKEKPLMLECWNAVSQYKSSAHFNWTLSKSADPDQTSTIERGYHMSVYTVCLLNVLSKFEEKNPPNNSKIRKGFVQLIRMGNSIRLKWVDNTDVHKADLWLYFFS